MGKYKHTSMADLRYKIRLLCMHYNEREISYKNEEYKDLMNEFTERSDRFEFYNFMNTILYKDR